VKVIPVIGDYQQFSRALHEAGVRTPLVPFVDFMATGRGNGDLSLSLLNEQIEANVKRLQAEARAKEGPS
jgi:hypothetical protein